MKENVPGDATREGYRVDVPPDSDLATLQPSELFEMNQAALHDAEQSPDIPLVGTLAPLASLREEYVRGNQTFVKQINWLEAQGFRGIRRTRGDGDCFYRAFAFAYIERVLNAPTRVDATLAALARSVEVLQRAGFDALVYEDFYETLVDLVQRIASSRLTHEELLSAFNEPATSNSLMMYMRYATSATVRTAPDTYAPYLYDPDVPYGEPLAPDDFCSRFVECMGKEADHVQMAALTAALGVNVRVAYLDGHAQDGADGETSPVNFVDFDNGEKGVEPVTLLYRPGHYDVLSRVGP